MIRHVFFKELLDHWRDRRSVLASLILPFIGPLMLLAVFELVLDLDQERPLEMPVVGAEHAPRLIRHLVSSGVRVLPAPDNPQALVRDGNADMVLVIDPSYGQHYRAGQTAQVQLIVDDSQSRSQKNVRRVERLLMGYAQTLGALRLLARGISPEAAAPLNFEEVDIATPEKLAANLLNVVPLFLMLAALIGGMNLAIDATAGERERGSLEPLLLNPVSRRAIVLGKWLATALTSACVALLTLSGFVLMIHQLPLERLGMKVTLGPKETAQILATILPLGFFGSALQMLIATFARTFKEAQTYLGLLNLLPMAPSLFLMLGTAQNSWWMLPVPAVAQVSTVVNVLRGEGVPPINLLVIALTSFAYSALCLFFLQRLLSKERIIFGR